MPRKDRKKGGKGKGGGGGGEKAPLLGRDGTIGAKPSAKAQPAFAFASSSVEYDVVSTMQDEHQQEEEEGRRRLPADSSFTSSSFSPTSTADAAAADAADGVSCESALFRNRHRTGKSVKQRVSRFFGLEDGDMPLQVAVRPSSSNSGPQSSTAQRQAGVLRPAADGLHGNENDGGGYHAARARRGEEDDIVAIDDGEYALASPLQAVPEDAPKAPSRSAPYFHGPMTAEDAKDRLKVRWCEREGEKMILLMTVVWLAWWGWGGEGDRRHLLARRDILVSAVTRRKVASRIDPNGQPR
jgi:hypothetical protein